MKPVDLKFKSIEVTTFDPRSETVGLRIIINDGKDKALVKTGKIEDPLRQAEGFISEIRTKIKDANKELCLDTDPLAGIIMVRVMPDEEELLEKMSRFLASIKERMRSARTGKLSYLEIEKKIRGAKATF